MIFHQHCHYRGAENGWCETIGNKGWGWCDSNCKYKEGSKEFEENVLATALQGDNYLSELD